MLVWPARPTPPRLSTMLSLIMYVYVFFHVSQRARATTKKIESPADLEGFPDLNDPEKNEIRQLIKEFVTDKSPAKPSAAKKKAGATGGQTTLSGASPTKPSSSG